MIDDQTALGDVATVTLGPDIAQSALRSDGKTGIGLGIIRQAQSNTLEISDGVRAAVANIQQTLPEGMNIRVTSDDAIFVAAPSTRSRSRSCSRSSIVLRSSISSCATGARRSFRPSPCRWR